MELKLLDWSLLKLSETLVELGSNSTASVQVSTEFSIGFSNFGSVLEIWAVLKRMTSATANRTGKCLVSVWIGSNLMKTKL